jgi:hypothetical protein
MTSKYWLALLSTTLECIVKPDLARSVLAPIKTKKKTMKTKTVAA